MGRRMPLSDAETIALVEELVGRANLAMINTLNVAAEKIFEQSQIEVPKSGDHQTGDNRPDYTLAESGRVVYATPESPVAQIVYEDIYATAQEIGHMVYRRESGSTVDWQASYYTTPGTKARYLEDPGKAILAQIPEELAIQGRIALGELPGLIEPRSSLKAAGTREQEMSLPTGEVATFMNIEQEKAQQATMLQTPVLPPEFQGIPTPVTEE